jgi:cytosine/creatinine deaminase
MASAQNTFTPPLAISSKGFQDWHCHADRAITFDAKYFAHQGPLEGFIDASLPVKQITVGVLHRGLAYTKESLEQRMTWLVEQKIAAGEVRLNMIVDCSPDIEGRAFEVALKLRAKYKKKIDIHVGAYPIFGFKTPDSDRQKHLEQLAKRAQFLVGLPERDVRPWNPQRIGFDGHLATLLGIAVDNQIPVQVHVDQTNNPAENGTERLIEAVRWLCTSSLPESRRPKAYAVHFISPSGADEKRYERIVHGLKENAIDVICCPRAAASMRQPRNVQGPTRSSIARVRYLLLAGIRVYLGTDNINDLFMPLPLSPLLVREIDAIADLERYYNINVLSKLARGEKLNETDLDSIARNVAGDYEAWGLEMPKFNRH